MNNLTEREKQLIYMAILFLDDNMRDFKDFVESETLKVPMDEPTYRELLELSKKLKHFKPEGVE